MAPPDSSQPGTAGAFSQAFPELNRPGGPAMVVGKQPSLVDIANDIERRLKILEDRYNTIRKKAQTTDENLLGLEKRAGREAKTAMGDLLELKRSVAAIQEKMAQFAAELKLTARRPDLRTLEAYLSFIEPMQFVTRQDLKLVLRDLAQAREANEPSGLESGSPPPSPPASSRISR